MKARLSAKIFTVKISFHSHAKTKTNFHMKSFAFSLALITGFTATRKWPIIIEKVKGFSVEIQVVEGRHLISYWAFR